MRFTKLQLQHFRNYESLTLLPHEGTTVIYGANGTGKTNLLEAMHLLSFGRSHRTQQDAEMVAAGQETASIYAETLRTDGKHDIEIRLNPGQKPRKQVHLYGKPARRITDLMGHATVVMFSPEDLRMVRDGPAARRRFMDMQLSQMRPAYLHALKTCLNVLESRNALLHQAKYEPVPDFRTQLETWDEQLARAAVPIVTARRDFATRLNEAAAKWYASICENPAETFSLRYESALADSADIVQTMLDGLARTRREDCQRMFTSFGPHRDDLPLFLHGRELKAFGSQGQVRTAVLSMKLGEISLIREEMGEPPVLLLDDVFSELDVRRRSALLRSAEGIQTLITCTDRSDASDAKADCFLHVACDPEGHGKVTPEEKGEALACLPR